MTGSDRQGPIACLGLAILFLGGPAAGGPITVTSPRAGETWCAGSTHLVTWTLDPNHAAMTTVTLAYSPDDGRTWRNLADRPAGSGTLSWVVPDAVSGSCRLRVSANGSAQAGKSGAFRIAPSREVRDYRWVRVNAKAAFAPRDGAGALTFRGKMWLLGGWNPGDPEHFPRVCSNDVWCSSDGRDWTRVKPNTFRDRTFDPTTDWEGRHTAGYVVFKDRLWIIGGDVNQGHYQPDVWNSADGATWTLVNRDRPVPWAPRALHYALAFRDRIWVMGGQTMPAFARSPEVFYRDVWTSADGRDWARVTPTEPFWSARGMIGGSVVFKDRMWVLGGGTYDTPTTPARRYFNDVWSSPDGTAWERHVEHAPWAARQYHDTAAFDGRLWVLEGYTGENRNDAWYSDDGSNWYEVPATPWQPRHAASVFVHDGALWMVAGNNMEPDVWKLVRGSALAAPAGRPPNDQGPVLLTPGARPVLLQEHGAGEGPAWHPKLGLLTSGDGDIIRRALDGKVSVYRRGVGSNGLMFDRQGRLVICEAAHRRVTRIEGDGRLTILADRYDNHRFNQPNDLALDSRGRIYFSDPCYGDRRGMEMLDADGRKVEGIYRIDPNGRVSRVISHEVDRPNGLVVTPDDRTLYVADNNNDNVGGARRLWRFSLRADGTIDPASRTLVYDWGTTRGPDGIKLDVSGRLFVAAGLNRPNAPYETQEKPTAGIYVFSPAGELLQTIPIPRDECTNCAFGDEDLKTLFVTAGGTLWVVRLNEPGRTVWNPTR